MHFRTTIAALPIAAITADAALALTGCDSSTSSPSATPSSTVSTPSTMNTNATTTSLAPTPISTTPPGDTTTSATLPEGHGVGASAFVGKWQRHESALTLNTDRTGSILIGSSAVDGETWSLTWEPVGKGITITVGDQIEKSGAGLNGYLSHGQVVTGEFSTGGSDTIILQTHGTGTDDSETLSWCSPTYGSAPECGA